MTWLSIIIAAIKLVSAFVGYLERQKLLEAGEAISIQKGLEEANVAVVLAQVARENYRAARDRGDLDPDGDDGFRRD